MPEWKIHVTCCTHATVKCLVRGTYQMHGENHGRPSYRNDELVNGRGAMLYYWDERDGAGFCGWWFGEFIGGNFVWAYHSDASAPLPPMSGWKVPFAGPVDATLRLAYYDPQAAMAPASVQSRETWCCEADPAPTVLQNSKSYFRRQDQPKETSQQRNDRRRESTLKKAASGSAEDDWRVRKAPRVIPPPQKI